MSEQSALSVPSTGVPTGSPKGPPQGSPLANPSVPSGDEGTGDGLASSGANKKQTPDGGDPRRAPGSPDNEEEKHP
jgi:hypothetical protein